MPKPRTGRAAPLTADEIRAMRANGDAFSLIFNRAFIRNRMGRDAVRTILFGEQRNA